MPYDIGSPDAIALKAELTNDPKSLGLTVLPADDEANANKLNLIRAAIKVKRRSVATTDVFDKLDDLEYQAMGPGQQRWMTDLLRLGQFDPFLNTGVIAGMRRVFHPTLTVTGPKLTALFLEDGSRINEMFQRGLVSSPSDVTPSHVANARQS